MLSAAELDNAWIASGDPDFHNLAALLADITGHVRLATENRLLRAKVTRRMQSVGLDSCCAYLDLLQSSRGRFELDGLIADVTIGETSFFRHPEHFDALRAVVIPDCLARNAGWRQLRIWSAGCANGAEAYSLAIVLHGLLGPELPAWTIDIVASDINRTFLSEAAAGRYSAWTLRDVPDAQRSAYFHADGAEWTIREPYKRHVRFVQHNLIGDAIPCLHKGIGAFDIIMCRNVMIYLDEARNRHLAHGLHAALAEGGWLFTAPTDFNPQLERLLSLQRVAGTLLYRRSAPVATAPRIDRQAAGAEVRQPREAPRAAAAAIAIPQPETVRPCGLTDIATLADRGEWQAAVQSCELLLRTDPCNAGAHYYHALVQHSRGATAAAELALKRAIYLDRDFALAHYQLAVLRKEGGALVQSRQSLCNVLDALESLPDERPISPCGRIIARDLRALAIRQLDALGAA
jgi:chemotaxis protein methyltransferase CheR